MAKIEVKSIYDKCKYCGSLLDNDGHCSKPCKIGALLKKLNKPQRPPKTDGSSEE